MTEIELNEQIEKLLTEEPLLPDKDRTTSARRREIGIRKRDALMRKVSRHYVPFGPYVHYEFEGKTLLHSGFYIMYPRKTKARKFYKRLTSKRLRHATEVQRKGNQYRLVLDYWWELD